MLSLIGFIVFIYLLGFVLYFGIYCTQFASDEILGSTENRTRAVIEAEKLSLSWPAVIYNLLKKK